MNNSFSICALVPMRHNSVRVQGKNYRPLAGKPLYQHILATLLQVPQISRVVVDTDSDVLIEGIAQAFPQVQVLRRPVELTADTVPMNEILMYDTSQFQADFYLQTHSTNPLLKAETISRTIDVFSQNYPAYDSLFSVTRLQSRLWDGLARPINHNPAILLRTQDLPPVYEENSCIYMFSRRTLEQRRNRIGERPYLYQIDAAEAWDIDEELDFLVADTLMSRRLESGEETKS